MSHAAPDRASSAGSGGRTPATSRGLVGRHVVRRQGQVAYLGVLIGVAIGLVIIGQGVHLVRSGTLVLAGALLVAATARLFLPERLAGMLSSRRRLLDVAIFGVLGVGLLVAGLVVPVPG
jgi:hypothetical protein